MPTRLANGKICYIEFPTTDTALGEFLSASFGWKVRKRGNGSTAFDDTTGEVCGTWVLGRLRPRPPQSPVSCFTSGLTAWPRQSTQWSATAAKLCRRSARTLQRLLPDFRDPSGNVIGLYQQPT